MQDFSGKIAVVTGGGSGMGRELVRLLVAEGCAIAMCDVSSRGMAETRRLCEAAGLPQGLRLTSHVADVSNAADVLRFRDEVADQHATDRIHLLFNNAGISGGRPSSVGGYSLSPARVRHLPSGCSTRTRSGSSGSRSKRTNRAVRNAVSLHGKRSGMSGGSGKSANRAASSSAVIPEPGMAYDPVWWLPPG
jgi:NAD(P)-dependent dehydrogenase (short-subunit alcohol dehydrogenase family)